MKARTKFQHQVVAANGRLLPITEKQAEWAFRHTVGHYAFRTPSGQTTCLDCGHRWNETKAKRCHCPNCHAKLTLKDTLCRKTDEKSYFSVITTQDGFQVQRIFRMNVCYRKGGNARTDVCEVARYWLDENGKTALTALQRTMGCYLDSFLYGSGLELRNDNYVYQRIADCYVCPGYTVI
ncbi:PcfJ-like protein, partial [Phocaeicola vulgatus]